MTKQVKSRERVAEHGEVFTAEREVNAMLDLVKQETERVDSRFLEPACGDGNFVAEILRRELEAAKRRATPPFRPSLPWPTRSSLRRSSVRAPASSTKNLSAHGTPTTSSPFTIPLPEPTSRSISWHWCRRAFNSLH